MDWIIRQLERETATATEPEALDFDLFGDPPKPPPRVSTRKAGPLGSERSDAAVAERDNAQARKLRRKAGA